VSRFYIDEVLTPGAEVELSDAVAHHAVRVLRLRDGADVTLFNGRGGEYDGRLHIVGRRAWVNVGRHIAIGRESPLAITLVQAWVAADKLDWLVEKAVELGVAGLILVPTTRSVVQLDGARRERRVRRLREIAISASCQCGRNIVPEIAAADTLREGLEAAAESGRIGLLLAPDATESAVTAVAAAGSISLVVGPEGGLEPAEHLLATDLGYRPVSLGPRILRTETAGLAAIAALQATSGDMH
jgi:16S rRNA (uracil1498-N3)-methyltransferase